MNQAEGGGAAGRDIGQGGQGRTYKRMLNPAAPRPPPRGRLHDTAAPCRLSDSLLPSYPPCAGRLADTARQMGVQQAGAIEDLSRGMSGLTNVFGGQIGGPVKDGVQVGSGQVCGGGGAQGRAGGSRMVAGGRQG
jgi:hypothetical protein